MTRWSAAATLISIAALSTGCSKQNDSSTDAPPPQSPSTAVETEGNSIAIINQLSEPRLVVGMDLSLTSVTSDIVVSDQGDWLKMTTDPFVKKQLANAPAETIEFQNFTTEPEVTDEWEKGGKLYLPIGVFGFYGGVQDARIFCALSAEDGDAYIGKKRESNTKLNAVSVRGRVLRYQSSAYERIGDYEASGLILDPCIVTKLFTQQIPAFSDESKSSNERYEVHFTDYEFDRYADLSKASDAKLAIEKRIRDEEDSLPWTLGSQPGEGVRLKLKEVTSDAGGSLRSLYRIVTCPYHPDRAAHVRRAMDALGYKIELYKVDKSPDEIYC
jgi:hypothetical protein